MGTKKNMPKIVQNGNGKRTCKQSQKPKGHTVRVMKNHMTRHVKDSGYSYQLWFLKRSINNLFVARKLTKYFPFIVKCMLKHYFPFSCNDNILLRIDGFAIVFFEDTLVNSEEHALQ